MSSLPRAWPSRTGFRTHTRTPGHVVGRAAHRGRSSPLARRSAVATKPPLTPQTDEITTATVQIKAMTVTGEFETGVFL